MFVPMKPAARTAEEQTQWDALFRELVLDCVRREGFRKALACLHLAREIADAALAERRESQRK